MLTTEFSPSGHQLAGPLRKSSWIAARRAPSSFRPPDRWVGGCLACGFIQKMPRKRKDKNNCGKGKTSFSFFDGTNWDYFPFRDKVMNIHVFHQETLQKLARFETKGCFETWKIGLTRYCDPCHVVVFGPTVTHSQPSSFARTHWSLPRISWWSEI